MLLPICRQYNYSWGLASFRTPETAPAATPTANDAWDKEEAAVATTVAAVEVVDGVKPPSLAP